MAKRLKCWRKTNEIPFNFVQYENSRGSKVVLQNQDPKWKISINNRKLKVLKNKSSAEKFAKSYMRKHDKC